MAAVSYGRHEPMPILHCVRKKTPSNFICAMDQRRMHRSDIINDNYQLLHDSPQLTISGHLEC